MDCPPFLVHPSSDSERVGTNKRFLFHLLLWLTPSITRGSAALGRATPITLKKIRDCLRSKLSTTKNIYQWYIMFSAFKSFLSCRGSCCFKEQSNSWLQETKIVGLKSVFEQRVVKLVFFARYPSLRKQPFLLSPPL